ncbi:hypothetical protein Trydic_g1139 [Trypoxylus dichotomus]
MIIVLQIRIFLGGILLVSPMDLNPLTFGKETAQKQAGQSYLQLFKNYTGLSEHLHYFLMATNRYRRCALHLLRKKATVEGNRTDIGQNGLTEQNSRISLIVVMQNKDVDHCKL